MPGTYVGRRRSGKADNDKFARTASVSGRAGAGFRLPGDGAALLKVFVDPNAATNLAHALIGVGLVIYLVFWGVDKQTRSGVAFVTILGASFFVGRIFIGLSFLMMDGKRELPSERVKQPQVTQRPAVLRYQPPPETPAFNLQNSPLRNIQDVVKNYVLAHAALPASAQFLQWSDFTADGTRGSVTLRYSLLEKSGKSVDARVRFTVVQGSVVRAEIVR